MDSFLDKHRDKIVGVLSCFDRIVFKGYLPFMYPEAMQRFLDARGVLYKDYKAFVLKTSERLKTQARALARKTGRPYLDLTAHVRKEDLVRKIADRDRITNGLVCILSSIETCRSFVVRPGKGRPHLESATRKCQHLYFYYNDPEFGLMYVRLQTWFPFTIQIGLNGHDWLARKMTRHGLRFRQLDNAFVEIEDFARAQRFADAFPRKKWPRILAAFARRVNPLLQDLLRDFQYYWVTDQAEYATDLVFRDLASLNALYSKLLRHATVCFSAEDVMTFLGRKPHGGFRGEVLSEYKRRWPGARIKHRMKDNWIKMYDKHGVVLRIETVINHPYEFKIRRRGTRDGQSVLGWFPLLKGVAYLGRYAEVALAANRRYLEALSAVEDPSAAYRMLDAVCEPVAVSPDRRRRGLNPLRRDDVRLFAAALRGEHSLQGFRNRDLARHLIASSPKDPAEAKRQVARVNRLIHLLRSHGLVAKIPRARRYRVTVHGHILMSAALYLRQEDVPTLLRQPA